ncbi:MAG TPA: sodium:solute symporter family protein [Gemmatimonadaceae bacterium]|nr:sodium:solute symporter family protein [Gemmatimonadaceae bacterium]
MLRGNLGPGPPTISSVSFNLALVVLILYTAAFIAVGFVVARRVKHADDFLVAGRSLGPGLLASTFLAANIGAGSTVGATGLGYVHGWTAWWWVGCAGIGSIILAQTVGPKIWTLAAEKGWRTVGDFLDDRYGRSVRGLIAVLLWAGTLMILAGQLIAISKILTVVANVPTWAGCAIGGAIVSTYFIAGGLYSSAWVNMIQMTVKLTGFALAVPFGIAAIGGWSGLQAAAHETTPFTPSQIVGYIAILVPSFIISPGLIQKLYGAKDARTVRVGVSWNAAGLLVYAFAPAILGMVAHARFPAMADQEAALPTVMTTLMPTWLGLLTLAAIFSAELSASDAALFMLSSSLSVDLFKRFLKPQATDRDVLLVGRVAAFAGAVVAVLLAIALGSIITALTVFYTLMAAALGAPLIVGLYSRRATMRRAIFSIVVSVAVTAFTKSGVWGTLTGFIIMLLP